MTFRKHLNLLAEQQRLERFSSPISKNYQIAGVMKKLEAKPILFEQVLESKFRVAGNILPSKAMFAQYFGVQVSEIIPLLSKAIEWHSPYKRITQAPCQETIILDPDLDALPILRHYPTDGGNYITSGVVIARHPQWGQNMDFHRCMQFSPTEMSVRVVRSRHFDRFLRDVKELDVAICIGNAPSVLAAAAISVDLGIDELEIANALEPLEVVQAKTVDIWAPAESEFILEGTVYLDRRNAEGPFIDLTETIDIVRQEPVFQVKAITHRRDAIWHALLPGALEHKLLMGMPREPTIYNQVNKVVKCLDVNINPGGCSWLHTIVQIEKKAEDDGLKAIQAAFAGHRSCKHVFVVDTDIDIYDPLAVEWAMATRFQGDRQMLVMPREQGSSLDPSSEPETHNTTKIGFDLTKPLKAQGKNFEKAVFPDIDPQLFR